MQSFIKKIIINRKKDEIILILFYFYLFDDLLKHSARICFTSFDRKLEELFEKNNIRTLRFKNYS